MFREAFSFGRSLSHFDMSNALDLTGMFSEANDFVGQGIKAWDTRNVRSMALMFNNAGMCPNIVFGINVRFLSWCSSIALIYLRIVQFLSMRTSRAGTLDSVPTWNECSIGKFVDDRHPAPSFLSA